MYPRLLGDMNGDGKADLVGFKGSGTWVALSTGWSFAPATLWSTNYSKDPGGGGWSSYDTYPRSLGDVDDSGRATFTWATGSRRGRRTTTWAASAWRGAPQAA